MKQLILWFLVFNWFALSYGQTSLWGTCTQSDYTNEATSTAFDANNNLYVAGYVTGEVAFNANVTFPNAQGNGDIYIAKYNVSGSLVWVRKFGGPMPDRAYGLAVDNLGNVLVTGQFFGEVDFDGTVLQSVANSKDIFLVKLNTLGNVIWARSEGGNLGDNVYGIATDGENNIILTGQFEGTANIGNQTFNSMINPQLAVPSYDLFISKYNSLGTPLWAISGTAKYEDRALAVKTDINNNIYVSGQFSDTLNLNGNIYDNIGFNIGFLAKLNPAGSTMWFNKITAGLVIPYDLDINIAGEIYLCGDFLGALIHQGTTGSQTLSNPFSRKVFVSKVNDSGGVIWQRALGSNNELSARGIAVSLDDKVYVTGHFRCALSELQEQNDATFNSVGFRDIYLWTLNDIGVVLSTKQMGGKKNDYSYDVALRSNLTPFICGSFTNNLNIPISSSASYTFANDAFSMSSLSSMQWLYFHGDQSVNSFVTGALFADSPTYNYFLNQPSDSLFGYIAQNGSLTFCEEDEITYVTQTHTNTGPGYDFLWNTGSTNQTIYAPTSGDYFVSVDRWDECVGYADTVFVNPLPNLPLLSDDIVEYTNAIIQEQGIDLIEYDRCAPDTFNIWFTPILPNETILISGPQTSYTDVNPNPYFASGLHSVVVTDEFCSHVGLFTINHDFVEENEIDPLPIFTDPEIENDTLIICQFEWSPIRVVDLLTNPNADISIIPDINVVSESFSINVNGANVPTTNPEDYFGFFQATTTGWYILNYELTTGYDNTCGIDTLYNQRFDSLYVIVNPLPSGFTTLALGSLLCPNGSVFITASNTFPNFSWSGPTIDWVSPNTDSAQVSEAGMYYYSGLLVDPVTGCTNSVSASILLIEKLPPLVITDPEDAIICPYDLVTFTVPNIYLDYNWTGPSGTSLSVTNTHIDTEMGFYFCTVLDDEGCYLTTPPVEIQEYSTPFLYLEPYNIICPGESLTISAFFSGIGSVNWLSPIVGNMQEITVSAPGWYSAELTACGITTIDSIFIIDGAFTVNISASDSILCFASTVLIQGDYQTGVYEWSNGMFGGANIQINEAGSYWASVTNEFGCIANSNTVDILFSEFSAPPDSYEITICVASEVTLNTSLNELVVWYDENLNALDTALTYTDFFDASVQFFVAYPQSLCPPVFGEISVILDPPILADYFILGESILCSDSDAEYSSNWTGDIAWFIDGNPSGNNPSVFINSVDYSDSIVLSASLSNSCYDTIIFLVVDVLPPFIMNLPFTDTTVCPYSEFMLPLGSIYSELFILNDTYFTTISELPIAVEETQLLFNMYGILENGCATDTVLVTINIHQVQLDIDTISYPNCVPDTLILSTNSGQMIIWSNGSSIVEADTLVLPIELAGPYLILATYTDSNGCEASTEFYFNVYNAINIPVLSDTIVCENTYFYTSFWVDMTTGVPIFSALDSVLILSNQTIEYTVSNEFDCPFSGTINVIAINCDTELPNVITPNGDGVNDYFRIERALIEPGNHLVILNRWGSVIFETLGYQNTFNASGVTEGAYFYVYTPKYADPNSEPIKGILHVIR